MSEVIAEGQEARVAEIERIYGVTASTLQTLAGGVVAHNIGLFSRFINNGVVNAGEADAFFIQRTQSFIAQYIEKYVPAEVKSLITDLIQDHNCGIQITGSLASCGDMTEEEFQIYAKDADMDLNLFCTSEENISPQALLEIVIKLAQQRKPGIESVISKLYPNGQFFPQPTQKGTPFVLSLKYVDTISQQKSNFSFALTPKVDKGGKVYVDPMTEKSIDEPNSANFRTPKTFTNHFRLAVEADKLIVAKDQPSNRSVMTTMLYTASGSLLRYVDYPSGEYISPSIESDPASQMFLFKQLKKMEGKLIVSEKVAAMLRGGPKADGVVILAQNGELFAVPKEIARLDIFLEDKDYIDLNEIVIAARFIKFFKETNSTSEAFVQEIRSWIEKNTTKVIKLGELQIDFGQIAAMQDIGDQMERIAHIVEQLGLIPNRWDAYPVSPLSPRQITAVFSSDHSTVPEGVSIENKLSYEKLFAGLWWLSIFAGIYAAYKTDNLLMAAAPFCLALNYYLLKYFRDAGLRQDVESAEKLLFNGVSLVQDKKDPNKYYLKMNP